MEQILRSSIQGQLVSSDSTQGSSGIKWDEVDTKPISNEKEDARRSQAEEKPSGAIRQQSGIKESDHVVLDLQKNQAVRAVRATARSPKKKKNSSLKTSSLCALPLPVFGLAFDFFVKVHPPLL